MRQKRFSTVYMPQTGVLEDWLPGMYEMDGIGGRGLYALWCFTSEAQRVPNLRTISMHRVIVEGNEIRLQGCWTIVVDGNAIVLPGGVRIVATAPHNRKHTIEGEYAAAIIALHQEYTNGMLEPQARFGTISIPSWR